MRRAALVPPLFMNNAGDRDIHGGLVYSELCVCFS